jgi:hypothetical protein
MRIGQHILLRMWDVGVTFYTYFCVDKPNFEVADPASTYVMSRYPMGSCLHDTVQCLLRDSSSEKLVQNTFVIPTDISEAWKPTKITI